MNKSNIKGFGDNGDKNGIMKLLRPIFTFLIVAIPIILGAVVLFRFIAPFGLHVSYNFNIAENAELFGKIRDVERNAYAEVDDHSLLVKDRFSLTKERVEFNIVPVSRDFTEIKVKVKLGSAPTNSTLIQVRDFIYDKNENFLLRNSVLASLGNPTFTYDDFRIWSFNGGVQTKEDLDNKVIDLSTKSNSLSVCTLDSDFYHPPILSDIKVSEQNLSFPIVLRGPHSFSVYVGTDRKLYFGFTKRDLNWYTGLDELYITLKKEGSVIRQDKVDDDGIYDGQPGRVTSNEQSYLANIDNLEPGVYEIFLDTTEDTLITRLYTRNPKFVINKDLFITNHGIYGKFAKDVTLYTYAPRIFISFYHDTAKNDIIIDGRTFSPEKLQSFESVELSRDNLSKIDLSAADLKISAKDYYALDKDGYFKPTIFDNINCLAFNKEVMEKQDLLAVRNIAEDKGNGYYELTIPFRKGYISPDGKVYFTLYSPGLGVDENKLELEYLQIELVK